ncbi:hypothetical protein PT974_03639 [Cladobotryum mycophilum]|uniref:F-box domain-containing protein n=1 Tax=Cladobotryum mycophilum TaxID=491253 RepID=A0ABR0SU29_9HYPO
MATWLILPQELRDMIFTWIKKDYSWTLDPRARVNYATVCKEWQFVFEPETFRQLCLDQNRLKSFKRFISENERRQSYVSHIMLRIKLEEYDCSVCELPEDRATIKRNDEIFVNTLRDFLRILSKWKRPENSGLTLDLGACSPSDGRHTFRDFRYAENYPYGPGYKYKRSFHKYENHSRELYNAEEETCPGWINANNGEPSLAARRRALSIIANSRASHFARLFRLPRAKRQQRPPKVKAITVLRIRRHYSRIISSGMLTKLFEQSLVKLQSFHHEKWHDVDKESQSQFTSGYGRFLYKSLPRTLTNLSLFEELNNSVHPKDFKRRPDAQLSRMLSLSSCNLQR